MIWRDNPSARRPWRARITIQGKKTQRSFGTKREAQEWVRREQSRAFHGLDTPPKTITYGRFVILFLAGYGMRSKPWLETMLRHSLIRFESIQLANIRSEDIAVWLNALDLAPKTKLHVLTAFRQVLRTAVEWGYLGQNPATASNVKLPKQQPSRSVNPFPDWTTVLRVAKHANFYGPLIRFACATGLRPQEWAALQWRDVDTENRLLRVQRTTTGPGKTTAALRTVSLSAPALRALSDQPPIASRTPSRLVFTHELGGQINLHTFRASTWPRILKAANLDYRPPYQMRHTYATLALAQDVPLEWISRQLGHTSLEVTLRHYARFLKAYDVRQVEKLDALEPPADEPRK